MPTDLEVLVAAALRELVDAVARDHLVDHPDSVLVARIAGLNRKERS